MPTPKGSADQEKYYTGSGFNITFFSIPYNVTDLNCSAAVLEILASESYRSTTPALFENDFKCRYSQDAEASEMFDMLRENVIYDVGRVFSAQFNHPYNLVRSTVNTGTSWATTAKASQKVWKTNLSSMLKSFD